MIGNCVFHAREQDGLWQCAQCDYVYKLAADKPPVRNCPNAPDLKPAAERLAAETGDPSILEKMAHYAVAIARWMAAGCPVRSPDEVERIYTEYCLPCERWDPEADACGICGCGVHAKGWAVRNLIAMLTERCHEGKW